MDLRLHLLISHHPHKGFLDHFGTTCSSALAWHLFGSLESSFFLPQPILYSTAQLMFLNLIALIPAQRRLPFACQIENKFLLLALMIQNRPILPQSNPISHSRKNYSCIPNIPSCFRLILFHMMFLPPGILSCVLPLGTCHTTIQPLSTIIHLFHEVPKPGVTFPLFWS